MTTTIILQGAIVPKARPRVTTNGTYMPGNYTQWKATAIRSIKEQVKAHLPKAKYSLAIALSGKHSRAGDLDNISGSIMDALVQSGILAGDNMTNIVGLSIEINHSKAEPFAEILLRDVSLSR
jgi:Holliday junction resolvase RusA-like endonuclease